MSGDSSEEGILEEMDRVRGDLGGGIDRLGEQVRNMFDWQSYVRSAPLTSVAIAATAGYLLAPRIRSSPSRNAGAGASSSGPGLFGMVSGIVVGAATQAASLYLGDLLTRELMGQPQANPDLRDPGTSAFDSTHDLGD